MNSIEICKANWRRLLVGDSKYLKNPDAFTTERIKECSLSAKKEWKKLKKHKYEDTVALFRETPISETVEMTAEYNSLRKIALGYATYGTECYNDSEVLTDILWALDWMNRHYYGKAELEGNGWRNYRLFNWYDWHIGTPEKLMDIVG